MVSTSQLTVLLHLFGQVWFFLLLSSLSLNCYLTFLFILDLYRSFLLVLRMVCFLKISIHLSWQPNSPLLSDFLGISSFASDFYVAKFQWHLSFSQQPSPSLWSSFRNDLYPPCGRVFMVLSSLCNWYSSILWLDFCSILLYIWRQSLSVGFLWQGRRGGFEGL